MHVRPIFEIFSINVLIEDNCYYCTFVLDYLAENQFDLIFVTLINLKTLIL